MVKMLEGDLEKYSKREIARSILVEETALFIERWLSPDDKEF